MSRTVPLDFRSAVYAQETGQIPVVLITIDHDDLAAPLRFSSDPTARLTTDPLVYGTISGGENFLYLPFSVLLPDDKAEAPPAARLVLDNIGRETIALLRSASTPASVLMVLVLASAPDVVVIEFPELDLISADYDAASVTISLAVESLLTEPFPAHSLDPVGFPGLF